MSGEYEVMMMAYTLMALTFNKRKDDREWLRRRWKSMSKRLKDNWFIKEITQEATEKAREEERRKLEEERRKLEEERRKLEEERKQELEQLRQLLIGFVQARFSDQKMERQARGQAALIDDPKILQDLILKIGLASTAEEAQDYLLSWPESA
jgi:histidinol-phosphate/aromatic aminotransferase/cobyric acid decarboxylase-like protein